MTMTRRQRLTDDDDEEVEELLGQRDDVTNQVVLATRVKIVTASKIPHKHFTMYISIGDSLFELRLNIRWSRVHM